MTFASRALFGERYCFIFIKKACFDASNMYNITMDTMDKTGQESIISRVAAAFPAGRDKDPTQLGPLVLAYIGDTVYDLYVRSMLIRSTGLTAHGLHMAAAKRVCAGAQAEAFRTIEPQLTEDELAVFRRGRNGHMGTIPRNASIRNYRMATGLEAVIGWLYLKGRDERICELMEMILKDNDTEV